MRLGKYGRKWGWVLVLAGLLVFMWPDINAMLFQNEAQRTIAEWKESKAGLFDEEALPLTGGTDLRNEMQDDSSEESVSEEIVFQQTSEIRENDDGVLSAGENRPTDVDPEILGYIEIPKMKVTLPLYWGASQENLSKGAGILETSSKPVGGIDSNCVIAGHRGYRGIPFFQEIELLEKGDLVYLTNLTETLTYMVENIAIVAPTDSDAVAVQEGKDMITLLTCHPYRSHGKQRYLVYCIRTENRERNDDGILFLSGEDEPEEKHTAGNMTEEREIGDPMKEEMPGKERQELADIRTGKEETVQSSREDIRRERWLRRGGLVLILSLLLLLGLQQRKRKEKS